MKAFIVDRYGKKDGARIGSRVRLFKPGDEVPSANSQCPSRTVGDSREGLRQGLCAQ